MIGETLLACSFCNATGLVGGTRDGGMGGSIAGALLRVTPYVYPHTHTHTRT